MYTTKWDVSKQSVTSEFRSFIKTLEDELHSMEGEITVANKRGKVTAEVELYNQSDPLPSFKQIEGFAKQTLGVENYTAWSSDSTIHISE